MITLPIKRKWFDMILSGEKKEEYREIKPYWTSRFMKELGLTKNETEWFFNTLSNRRRTKDIDVVFRNGYSMESLEFKAKVMLFIGYGNPEWGAEPGKLYYILTIDDGADLNAPPKP